MKFLVGGCDHFTIELTFSPIPRLTGDTPPQDLMRVAQEIVGALPINKADEVWMFNLKEALTSQVRELDLQSTEAGHTFSCGEFKTCEIGAPSPRFLQLSYVFAL